MIPVLTSFAAGDLLPADDNTIDCGGDSGAKCFKAGDVRVNEHIGLVSERKYELIIIFIIIITRPKPPYGRQGLAGSWTRIQSGGYILGRSQRLTSRLRRSARIG